MMTLRSTLLLAACAVALAGCDKTGPQLDELTEPATGVARVKFFHFGVGGPGVNFYSGDRKLTAVFSSTGVESAIGTNYGGVGGGGLYTALEPGQHSLSGRIAASTNKNLPIATVPATLSDGKQYSFYLSGVYNAATKTQDAFVVEDNLPPLDHSVACVRFVNAIANSLPMTLTVTHTVTKEATAIGGPVAYKSAGAYTCLAPGSYTLATTNAGSNAKPITRTAVAFGGGRVYTIAARGDVTVTSTTAATRPLLDFTANR